MQKNIDELEAALLGMTEWREVALEALKALADVQRLLEHGCTPDALELVVTVATKWPVEDQT